MTLAARITSLARRDALTTLGLALSGVWLLLVLLFWLFGPEGDSPRSGIGRLVQAMGLVLPVVLIWLAVSMARALTELRAEAAELQRRLAQMRGDPPHDDDDFPASDKVSQPARAAHSAAGKHHAPAPTQATATSPALSPTRPRTPGDQRQAALRLDAPGAPPVDSGTLIRALNFPDGPDDQDAIEALRLALRDQDNSRVLRAAQDVVTLLAGRDIYMDMLPPAPAPADVWRRFAEGQRGSAVAALGGIEDADALEIVTAMMRKDVVFRDTAHHFLRHFDALLARMVPGLDDAQIAVLADSRSARAFMLLGRAAGGFG